MPILNKLFKKSSSDKIAENKKEEKKLEVKPGKASELKSEKNIKSKILISAINTEKALAGQSLNRYVFKVAPSANKIGIAKEVGRVYNVKAVSVNIINIPKKARKVGKTKGFKTGYKKAIVALAEGQTIEIK